MLKYVVRDWLARVTDEREIDVAITAYLAAAGFRDVHFTHGPNELGKDFIAKVGSSGDTHQYVVQSKSGDIASGEWRTIREQMWEAVRLGISHPSFANDLPRQGVLALTGQLKGGAREQIDKFNEELRKDGKRPIAIWHREELVRLFSEVDPTTVYRPDRHGYSGYGKFFTVYGDALDAKATPRQIERHSRNWLTDASYGVGDLLLPAVEASVIASAMELAGDFYGAFQTRLALARVVLDAAFSTTETQDKSYFDTVAQLAISGAILGAERFCEHVFVLRENAPEKKLVHVVSGPAIATYPALCLQIGEALAFIYLTSDDETVRERALKRLRKLVVTEPGMAHPLGDRYAVSVVAVGRALLSAGECEVAKTFLRNTAYYVLNLYATRVGLADVEDDERDEVNRLFGADFPTIRPAQRSASFMATALLDLCAFGGFADLYEDIENDIRCHGMYPTYYRPLDTRGQFRVHGEDVTRSINVRFLPSLVTPHNFEYGEHLVDEPRDFRFAGRFKGALIAVSLLLRDRYFPTSWTQS